MRLDHIGLALLVVAVWGSNFVVIKHGLAEFPPFLFATLRFFFCAIPFALFVPRPRVAWKWLVLYGVFLGAGQFGLLFYAMRADISPGLTSLVVQVQVFFTIALSMILFNERVSRSAFGGLLLACAGLAIIGWHLDATTTAKGVACVVSAAFFWGCANVTVKKAALESKARVNMFAFIVWSSFFAVPPLLLLTLIFDGPAVAWTSLTHAGWVGWSAVAWQSLTQMLFAFAAWSWLLTRYDASIVTPYALLVPVFGMGSSAVLLGEPLPPWKLTAFAIVLAGIAMSTLIPALIARHRR
jgi:O-acetylserine/cysteine efflux transporter